MFRSVRARAFSAAIAAAAVLLLAGCIPGGPPSPEQVSDQFAEAIEPAWQADVDGIMGEPVVRDGLVFVYADDESDGMRLEVRNLDDGEIVWQHVASPGGAYANPILGSVNSAGRSYPYPSITPIVIERGEGEDAQLVVVFFEREIVTDGTLTPDDFLRVADARTGDLLEVTFEPYDEFELRSYGVNEGEVYLNVQNPGRRCGEARICFETTNFEVNGATAEVALDVETLSLAFEPIVIPPSEETVIAEWGPRFGYILGDETTRLGKYEDGALVWEADIDALFDDGRTSPAEYIDFVEVGDLVLIQGYQSLLETLDADLPHTLELDFVASRTLVAVDSATGEVAWRAPGVDMLCTAVSRERISDDATTVPVCNVTAGAYVYDLDAEQMVDQVEIVSSIAELTIADGSLGWEAEGTGGVSLAQVGRLLQVVYASGNGYAVESEVTFEEESEPDADEAGTAGDVTLVDLATGDSFPSVEGATFVCKMERPDVELDFEGSVFAGGSNPITTGYPAGWWHFPCTSDGDELETWSKGAVRIAGYPDAGGESSLVVLPTEGGLVAFDIG